MLPWARYAANACVIVLLVQEHMLLNASEGEISSAVEHEAKLRKMPHVASKVHRQLGSSKAHTAGYCPVEHCHLLQAPKSRDKDGDETTQRKVKEAQKEELDRQNRAQTNQALAAAGVGPGGRTLANPRASPQVLLRLLTALCCRCACVHTAALSAYRLLCSGQRNMIPVAKATQIANWRRITCKTPARIIAHTHAARKGAARRHCAYNVRICNVAAASIYNTTRACKHWLP